VVEATGAFQLGDATSTSYVSAIGASSSPRLSGYDLGSVNALTGPTLLQTWFFEHYADNGGGTPAGAATNNEWLDGNNIASLLVTIKSGATTVSLNTYALTQTGNSGNNRFWRLAAACQNTNLAAGLANGSHSVEFTTTFNVNRWIGSFSRFNASTATSTATFTVIPAPGAAALVVLAGLVASRRRK
jgi:uncharacterized protein (TIGR03382 family)